MCASFKFLDIPTCNPILFIEILVNNNSEKNNLQSVKQPLCYNKEEEEVRLKSLASAKDD
jgi:hypothetical protein